MLNLFSNLLNRNKSANQTLEGESVENADNQASNYLNLKNLKRATSSTHFAKSKSKLAAPSSPTINTDHNKSNENSAKFLNPTSLFSLNSRQTKPDNSEAKKSKTNSHLTIKPNKYRRSFDDVSTLLGLSVLPSANANNTKFENTAFSTKNNGLIFIPSSTSRNLSPEQCNSGQSTPVQLNIVNLTVKSKETLSSQTSFPKPPSPKASDPNEPTQSSVDDGEAFDNVVYSYVDNLRQHSKRLSEISNASVAQANAAAVAAVAAISREENSIAVKPHHSPHSSSVSSNSSSSSSFSSTPPFLQHNSRSSPSHQLATSAVQQKLASPSLLSDTFEESTKNSMFENRAHIRNLKAGKANPKSYNNLNSPSNASPISSSTSSSATSLPSPNSLSSTDTLIVNSNLKPTCKSKPNTPSNGHNVLSLRDKFEQFGGDLHSKPSSVVINRVQRSSTLNLSHETVESSSPQHAPHSLPIFYQTKRDSCIPIQRAFTYHGNRISINSTNGSSDSDSSESGDFGSELNFSFFFDLYSPDDQLLSFVDKHFVEKSAANFLLNPVLGNEENATFKFTVDHCRQILFGKRPLIGHESRLQECNWSDANKDEEKPSSALAHLLDEMIANKEIVLSPNENFAAHKQEVKQLLKKRLAYFMDCQKKVLASIEMNEKLGHKVSYFYLCNIFKLTHEGLIGYKTFSE